MSTRDNEPRRPGERHPLEPGATTTGHDTEPGRHPGESHPLEAGATTTGHDTEPGRHPLEQQTTRVESAEATRGPTRDPRRGVVAARERFGGLDVPATLVGMLTALATLAILGGVVGSIVGAIGYQTGIDSETVEDISIASLIGGLVVLLLAYLIGGWAAGRIARYDGARNGLMTGIWTIVLAAILSALAAWGVAETEADNDVLRDVNMPQWFSSDALTTAGIISAVVAIATMLLAGALGGMWGERYHRRADRHIVDEGQRVPLEDRVERRG